MKIKSIAIIENHIISTNTVRRQLTKSLQDSGLKVTVLSTGTTKEMNLARSLGFSVIDVGSSATNILEVAKYIYKVHKALKLCKADVCLTFTMRPAIWGNLVCKKLKIPVITNITGIGPLAHSTSFPYRVARLLYKRALTKTRLIFFQNKDDLQIFLDRNFVEENRTQVIPGSGVDTNYFLPLVKSSTEEKFVFLFISRLIKDKGILEYAAAAKKLKLVYPNLIFQVIGPYYDQNLKENTISEKEIMHWLDEGIINYLGAAEDVRSFIANADCIVLPSYREGMSNVLLEAASMERPSIASNVTGCKEIIIDNKTGFLCNVKDVDDLIKKMLKMVALSADERVQMGKLARQNVIQKFEKKIVIDAYFTALENI
jgi:glycosyltransferase involved in cell wall biosynthesis